jgi:uncharacterized membrane protein YkvA (DUF1232 family)
MRITFELSEADLDHFREVMRKATSAAEVTDAEKITAAAQSLLDEVGESDVPEFISDRLKRLETLILMVHDQGWDLPGDERQRVLSALAYFSDPEDLIPDEIPGLGFLDDAIMIELVVRELKHEIEAYQDFCYFRNAEATRRGADADELDRADWLVERRKQLHSRMRRRRRGPSSGRRRRGGRIGSLNLFG